MRIVMVWLTALILCMFITVGWYISNLMVTQIAVSNLLGIGAAGSEGYNLAKLLEYVNIAWGPLFDVIVVLWAIASSARHDVTSEAYY